MPLAQSIKLRVMRHTARIDAHLLKIIKYALDLHVMFLVHGEDFSEAQDPIFKNGVG